MAPDFNRVRRLAQAAVDEHVIPGLVLGLGQGGRRAFLEAFGQRQLVPSPEPTHLDVVYDLASLSKALVTSILVMRGVADGVWGLDQPLGKYLPALEGCAGCTLRRALAHAAGFAAHRAFYAQVLAGGVRPPDSRKRILALAGAEPLAYEPGAQSLYSDLGFMLLGELIERGLGGRLDALADRLIFRPLGLTTAGFPGIIPSLGAGLSLLDSTTATEFGKRLLSRHDVAPTEECPVRNRLIWGEVHDLNTYAMDGVAGHAGLFGTAADVLLLTDELLAAWRGSWPASRAPLVSRDVLRVFWQPAGIPGSTWRLGWDGPSSTGSLAGDRLSRRAVGHLGFTGCSLWIDPEREVSIVLLSNFVHPKIHRDPRFRALRPALHDALLDAIAYPSQ